MSMPYYSPALPRGTETLGSLSEENLILNITQYSLKLITHLYSKLTTTQYSLILNTHKYSFLTYIQYSLILNTK